MNSFDSTVSSIIFWATPQTKLFNTFVVNLSGNELLKGGALSAAIWWLWFRQNNYIIRTRITLLNTLLASLFAVAITRVLVLVFPHRTRPIFANPENYNTFMHQASVGFDGLSSFPSDHATLAISLAFGAYCASKKVGYFVLSYSLIFILIPRIYLGLHYATDIIAGAFIGIFTVLAFNSSWLSKSFSARIFKISEKYPQLFYAAMFLFTYETSDLYIHLRNIARFTIEALL